MELVFDCEAFVAELPFSISFTWAGACGTALLVAELPFSPLGVSAVALAPEVGVLLVAEVAGAVAPFGVNSGIPVSDPAVELEEEPAPAASVGEAAAGAALPASDRGIGSFAFVSGVTFSTLTLLLPVSPTPIAALVAERMICGALVCCGSTRVGSPILLARARSSGALWKVDMTLPTLPISERLASSALYDAIASGVGVGIGRPRSLR